MDQIEVVMELFLNLYGISSFKLNIHQCQLKKRDGLRKRKLVQLKYWLLYCYLIFIVYFLTFWIIVGYWEIKLADCTRLHSSY